MFKDLARTIYEYYQFIILPFLSVSIFYAMEYMTKGADFFINEKGIKWRFLTFSALMQFFVSLVVIISTIALFESEALAEYKTLKMVCVILLGTTPFNISILIWVAIKLEIYRIMKTRYKNELNGILNTQSLINQVLTNNAQNNTTETLKEQAIAETPSNPTEAEQAKETQNNTLPATENASNTNTESSLYTQEKHVAIQNPNATQEKQTETITQEATEQIKENLNTQDKGGKL